jgi:hypothetical protein
MLVESIDEPGKSSKDRLRRSKAYGAAVSTLVKIMVDPSAL